MVYINTFCWSKKATSVLKLAKSQKWWWDRNMFVLWKVKYTSKNNCFQFSKHTMGYDLIYTLFLMTYSLIFLSAWLVLRIISLGVKLVIPRSLSLSSSCTSLFLHYANQCLAAVSPPLPSPSTDLNVVEYMWLPEVKPYSSLRPCLIIYIASNVYSKSTLSNITV